MKSIRHLCELVRDSRGFGAMELGLSLPFLMLLCLGMMDASSLLSTKIDFEQAAQRTTDLAFARRPNSDNGAEYSAYVAEAKNAAGVDSDAVTVEIFLECDGERQDEFEGVCDAGEMPARFVNVVISDEVETRFDWGSLVGLLGYEAFPETVTVTGDSLVRFQ